MRFQRYIWADHGGGLRLALYCWKLLISSMLLRIHTGTSENDVCPILGALEKKNVVKNSKYGLPSYWHECIEILNSTAEQMWSVYMCVQENGPGLWKWKIFHFLLSFSLLQQVLYPKLHKKLVHMFLKKENRFKYNLSQKRHNFTHFSHMQFFTLAINP